ncbi:hypothetical protein [Microbacterium sp. NPDC089188]|uniref:hypothetical protein n=1 Tax=Microbacterium sp. NPDC089188 TaxID=3154971 RepID=UPI00343B90AE
MASELYRFEFGGAPFSTQMDEDVSSYSTTTDPPNVRTVEGKWKTWHLSIPDPKVGGLAGVRLVRSVGSDGGPHPRGNLTAEESEAHGSMLMVAGPTGNPVHVPGIGDVDGGETYGVPGGWGIISRFYTDEEWDEIRATWEAWVRSQ